MDVSNTPPLIYGVWIRGKGWLKNQAGLFATTQIEVAQTAAKLYGRGAAIMPLDESLKDFEGIFLEREKARSWHI